MKIGHLLMTKNFLFSLPQTCNETMHEASMNKACIEHEKGMDKPG